MVVFDGSDREWLGRLVELLDELSTLPDDVPDIRIHVLVEDALGRLAVGRQVVLQLGEDVRSRREMNKNGRSYPQDPPFCMQKVA